MSRTYSTQALLPAYAIKDQPVGTVRLTKRELRFDLESRLEDDGVKADGHMAFRTYAQSGFNPWDLVYREAPWIPGTPLPEWATLVRVEAEVQTL